MKANPRRWYLQCVGGCGFLRWADVGEEQGCPICREPESNVVAITENEKDIAKDEDVIIAEEPDSYVYFEDQDSKILRPYLEQETDNEKIFEDPTKDYDPEVLEHAWITLIGMKRMIGTTIHMKGSMVLILIGLVWMIATGNRVESSV
ncbi:hypothetical protein HanOQP8_Chr02g0053241 [Helianthus annuus]|nr:hypothetical protein HanOQP8_Chr02g0053241 [Helianthus annuus]